MQVTDERTALEKSTQVEQVEGEEKGNDRQCLKREYKNKGTSKHMLGGHKSERH